MIPTWGPRADSLGDLLAAHALGERHDHDGGEAPKRYHRPIARRDDVEHPDLRLRLEERSHVRRNLWNILHDQEPDLFACHPSLRLRSIHPWPRHDDASFAVVVERFQVM